MGSIGDTKKSRGGSGGSLLKGSDVPAKIHSLKVEVESLEESPSNFNAPCILRFSESVYECEAMAINKTNLTLLAEALSVDESEDLSVLQKKIKGKTVTLAVLMVNNPQTGKPARSFQVSAVS